MIFCFDHAGRFTEFGGPVPYRPAEDMAFAVARFIQTGGSFINYYMVIHWSLTFRSMFLLNPRNIHFPTILVCSPFFGQYHGGTNFGRTSGGPFIATSYDYDAPLDEFGTFFL